MRITFIAGEYPPLQGGLGDFTRELARALAAAGHEPHVITRMVPGAPREEVVQGVQVHRSEPGWGWTSLRRIAAFIRAHRPHVLNLQYQAAAYGMHPAVNLLPALFARRVPTIVTFHDLKVPYLFPKAGPLRWQAILSMARSATAAIVTNREDDEILAQAGITRRTRIPIGSNITPVSLEGFTRQGWMQARAIPAGTRLIGYFGFMNESKGGEVLIRALAELRAHGQDVTLLLIGGQTGASDPTNIAYARHMTQLAGELRVQAHIVLTGYLDERGVSAALAACDCIALPYRDGVSFRRGTLMAALAHGCAVVTTTPRVALPELVDGQNVLLVPPDSPAVLASALRRVLSSPELQTRLQAGSRELSVQFGWDRIAAASLRVYNHTIRHT
ncbi:MAG: glycosyltransferase family 4 protein [Chloroflexi bacterium]|nr:glycosyltransferase family 4 protein [Chloroflexota bacterium]